MENVKRTQTPVHYYLLFWGWFFFLDLYFLFSSLNLLQTLFPSPTSALVMGVWADPFVPTAILGETHFLFPIAILYLLTTLL